MVHIYNGTLFSHEKEQNNAIDSNVDAKRDSLLHQVSQKEKDKYHMISLICGIKNMAEMNLSEEKKQTHRYREQTCGCQAGGGECGMDWELGMVDANYYICNG